MSSPQMTTSAFLGRIIAQEQETFTDEANRLAEQAAHIAANPPTTGRGTVSGDLTRLIQSATFLLQRAVKIEATIEAVGLMASDNPNEQ